MSLEDYNAIQKTLHLLSSPRKAGRLMKSIRHIEAGGVAWRAILG
jgi:PHD/YefM family antitoxin component YafN of YafNO toxin-antitoxin module